MLHLATIEPHTLGLLKSLMQKEYLKPFILVGGTSLPLQIGHRKSIDLDLFTTLDVNTDELLAELSLAGNEFPDYTGLSNYIFNQF